MKKAILIIVLLISILTLFCGCSSGVKMPDGLEAGFYYEDCDDPYFYHYSAFRSAKTEFDIDDVTINLYYGLEAGYNSGKIGFGEGHLLRIAAINRNDYSDCINADTKQIDIREISGSEISANSDLYKYNIFYVRGGYVVEYNHCEQITIPSELFQGESGEIIFGYYYMFYEDILSDIFNKYTYSGIIGYSLYYRVEGNKVYLSSEAFD